MMKSILIFCVDIKSIYESENLEGFQQECNKKIFYY